MSAMHIGELVRRTDLGPSTIGYYERQGLIKEPQRQPAHSHPGYRLNTTQHVKRLRFICRARELGFRLREIKEKLDLEDAAKADNPIVREK